MQVDLRLDRAAGAGPIDLGVPGALVTRDRQGDLAAEVEDGGQAEGEPRDEGELPRVPNRSTRGIELERQHQPENDGDTRQLVDGRVALLAPFDSPDLRCCDPSSRRNRSLRHPGPDPRVAEFTPDREAGPSRQQGPASGAGGLDCHAWMMAIGADFALI
jgi:hypothetical protein